MSLGGEGRGWDGLGGPDTRQVFLLQAFQKVPKFDAIELENPIPDTGSAAKEQSANLHLAEENEIICMLRRSRWWVF